MCSARDNVALPTLGFPIRASAGHWPFSASPRLIAAVHALHRLLVPRHPPCALNILTVIAESRRARFRRKNRRFFQSKRHKALALIPVTLATVQFSRSEKRRARLPVPDGPRSSERRRRAGLSKLNSMRAASLRRKPARAACQVRSTLLELIARGDRCPKRAP